MVVDSYTTSRESSVFCLSVIRRTLTQDNFILKMRHLIFISYNVHLTQDVLLRKDKTLHTSSFCLLIMVDWVLRQRSLVYEFEIKKVFVTGVA